MKQPTNIEKDRLANYWKVEARENGYPEAGDIDHRRPDERTALFLMEARGEL